LPQAFKQSTLLVSWHEHLVGKPIPPIEGWNVEFLQADITLLTPLT
jgi:hypothetical protein